MRDAFGEFYAPQSDDYRRLLTEGLIVLDTNVLLQAYELPQESREALLDTLEKLQGRLWIPFHVGLEFQSRRLSVIAKQLNQLDGIFCRGKEAFQRLRDEVDGLELKKRGVALTDAALKEALGQAEAELLRIVEETKGGVANVSLVDPIRDRIDVLFGGRVGPPPADQQQIDQLGRTAQERYDCEIPPGFKDANKDKDDPEAGRMYARGLRYERKYGDFYIWSQTLDHVRTSGQSVVLFVTSDLKRDWWLEVKKTILGPLPALVREMKSVGGAGLFWMYSLSQFLDQANVHLDAKISPSALKEVEASEDAARDRPSHERSWSGYFNHISEAFLNAQGRILRALAEQYELRGYLTDLVQTEDALWIIRPDHKALVRTLPWLLPPPDAPEGYWGDLRTKVRDLVDQTPPQWATHVVLVVPEIAVDQVASLVSYPRVLSLLRDVARAEGVAEISLGYLRDGGVKFLMRHQTSEHE